MDLLAVPGHMQDLQVSDTGPTDDRKGQPDEQVADQSRRTSGVSKDEEERPNEDSDCGERTEKCHASQQRKSIGAVPLFHGDYGWSAMVKLATGNPGHQATLGRRQAKAVGRHWCAGWHVSLIGSRSKALDLPYTRPVRVRTQ